MVTVKRPIEGFGKAHLVLWRSSGVLATSAPFAPIRKRPAGDTIISRTPFALLELANALNASNSFATTVAQDAVLQILPGHRAKVIEKRSPAALGRSAPAQFGRMREMVAARNRENNQPDVFPMQTPSAAHGVGRFHST